MLEPCRCCGSNVTLAQYIIGRAMTNIIDSHIKVEANIYYANNHKRPSEANGIDARVYTFVYDRNRLQNEMIVYTNGDGLLRLCASAVSL